MGLRSVLYRLARVIGDLNAVYRGPKATMKRAGRKMFYRVFFKYINRR